VNDPQMGRNIQRIVLGLTLFAFLWTNTLAQPANIWQFKDCFSGNTTERALKLNVTAVYAQILNKGTSNAHLNLTLLGESGQQILGEGSGKLGKQAYAAGGVL
jgi:hypothetical protein